MGIISLIMHWRAFFFLIYIHSMSVLSVNKYCIAPLFGCFQMFNMGQQKSKSPFRLRLQSRIEAWGKAASGSRILSCSFERWVHFSSTEDCFFQDYSTKREDFRGNGFRLRPNIRDRQVGYNDITIEDKGIDREISVKVETCFKSWLMQQKLPPRFLATNCYQQHANKNGFTVVGCKGNLAIVQVVHGNFCFVPQFYFIDMQRQISLGKFASELSEPIWYECYISPDKSCILLRPKVNGQIHRPDEIIKTLTVNKIMIMIMRDFPDSGGHVLTFDNRHGHRFMFRAKDKDIELFDFEKMCVVKSNKDMELPTSIRQIKSSPSGAFLAVRCADTLFINESHINTVVVLIVETLDILFSVDVQGPFWPISEVIDQQVFPGFSACETGLAIMRNKTSKRKVAVYKLPVLCSSLQHFCRRTVRCYVPYRDLNHLPLPDKLILYLGYGK